MKTSKDPRHLDRIKTMQELFAYDFSAQNPTENGSVKAILEKQDEIDEYIKSSAPLWPLEKINKIDLAILRQAVFELMVKKEVPTKVIVDEAVEIAKSYGSESSPSFINGALGKLISDQKL